MGLSARLDGLGFRVKHTVNVLNTASNSNSGTYNVVSWMFWGVGVAGVVGLDFLGRGVWVLLLGVWESRLGFRVLGFGFAGFSRNNPPESCPEHQACSSSVGPLQNPLNKEYTLNYHRNPNKI